MGEKRLRLAVGAALVEVTMLIGALLLQGTLGGAPLRIVFLAIKIPFCHFTLRRNAAAYLVLWLYEIAAVVGAVRSDGPAFGRVGVSGFAIVVMVLLGRASSVFPPVEWKSR